MSTRQMIIQSWLGARRNVERSPDGVVTLTAASFAGYALDVCGGDVQAARRLVPLEPGDFWGRVLDALDQVAIEDAPPRAVGGSLR